MNKTMSIVFPQELAEEPEHRVGDRRPPADKKDEKQAAGEHEGAARRDALRGLAVRVRVHVARPARAQAVRDGAAGAQGVRVDEAVPRPEAARERGQGGQAQPAAARGGLLAAQGRLEPERGAGQPGVVLRDQRPARLARAERRELQRLHPLHADGRGARAGLEVRARARGADDEVERRLRARVPGGPRGPVGPGARTFGRGAPGPPGDARAGWAR